MACGVEGWVCGGHTGSAWAAVTMPGNEMCASARPAGESSALGGAFVAGAIRAAGAVVDAGLGAIESVTAGDAGALLGGMSADPPPPDDRACGASCGGAPG